MTVRIMGQANSAMSALQKKLDTIGHNLANSNTHGYKARRVEFQSLLKQHMNNLNDPVNTVGRETPVGLRLGTGSRVGSTNNNLALGAMQRTDRPLDTMLLQPNHFYQVRVQQGQTDEIRYTRSGNFHLSQTGNGNDVRLVTSDGNTVYGENGPIEFAGDFDDIQINSRGEVWARYEDNEVLVGRLAVVEITRPRLLEAVGENLFRLPNLEDLGYAFNDIVQPIENADGIIQNNVLEMSNVQIQDEMVEMINAQRAYQLNARSITTADQMQGLINQLR